MRERILEEIEKRIYVLPEQLADALELEPAEMMQELTQLEQEGEICYTKHKKVALASTMGFFKGVMDCKKGGFAFVRTAKHGDIFIAPDQKQGALHGETVIVKLTKRQDRERNLEGRVHRILSVLPMQVIGTTQSTRNTMFVVCDVPIEDVYITKGDTLHAKNQQKVVVSIERRGVQGRSPEGRIVEILGDVGDTAVEILSVARKFGLIAEFDEKCQAAAAQAQASPQSMEGRKDCRDWLIVTIDGADAKDLDDAVSFRKLSNGNVQLGVHIADVSQYVVESSVLDREALKRGTSVYLVDRVVPMLPKELSDDLCSLNPQEDKLTLSCMMEISPQGEVVSHEMAQTIICTKYRLTYEAVNRMLEGDANAVAADAAAMLCEMNALAKIMRARRFEKGSIDFDIDEAKIVLNDAGMPVEVGIRERGDAEKLIEEFMLAANMTVAESYFYQEIPFLYRIHEQPDTDKMRELAVFLSGFGLTLKGVANIHPRTLQQLLESVQDKPEGAIINQVTLRSLKKAKYDTVPLAHFGLAAERYCHFTSPIRRYPDLQVHRIIKATLRGEMSPKYIRHLEQILPEVAQQSGERERKAIEAERAVEDIIMAQFMGKHIGEEYDAVVSGVTRFGVFAELPSTIEGMIPLAQMHDDYYVLHEKTFSLVGERTKRKISLGDKIRVRVVSADVASGKIEFAKV